KEVTHASAQPKAWRRDCHWRHDSSEGSGHRRQSGPARYHSPRRHVHLPGRAAPGHRTVGEETPRTGQPRRRAGEPGPFRAMISAQASAPGRQFPLSRGGEGDDVKPQAVARSSKEDRDRGPAMADSPQFRHLMADLLRLAVRSFCGTLFLMSCVGLMLAGGAYLILARDHVWVAGLGALAALIEALLVGSSWAFKRALLRAALAGLNRYGLGKATVRLLFGRALGPSAEEATGGWRGAFTRSVERLPLAEAERRLARAVQQKETSSTSGGLANRLWRWLQRRLVRSVQTLTLARLREYNARHG